MNASDIMSQGCECISESDTLLSAAQRMRDLHVGALPICSQDNRLIGILTDRDIVVKCIAQGSDPRTTTAGELAEGNLVWVDANAGEDEVLHLMEENKVRRVPVLRESQLVGMISEADIARHLDDDRVAEFVHSVYSGPATS